MAGRPPVRQATVIRAGQDHTFDTFVRTIARWWPLEPFSRGHDRIRDVIVDGQPGGRIYEIWDDGSQADWGEILVWEPPARFCMTWVVTGHPTEVEFNFQALGPALTRVSVEHRGWEHLNEEELRAACALPGGYAGGAFHQGWAHILSCLTAAIESRD